MNRKPLALFSGVAAVALAALGITIYETREPATPVAASTTSAQEAAAPAASQQATAEQPAAAGQQAASAQPAAEQPAAASQDATQPAATQDANQQQAAVQPAPDATQPATQPAAEAAAPAATGAPSFDTVRVEPTGEAVIAGHAAPGASVIVKLNGAPVGTATANADGSFALVPDKPLPAGDGALSLEVNDNGKVIASADTVVVAIKGTTPPLVAKVDPAQPTQVAQVPAATNDAIASTVQLNAVDYDDAGNIVFSGRAAPGAVVRFYVDNQLAGEAMADAQGQWRFKGQAVTPGTHNLRADAVDAAGKVISRVELPFLRETPEAIAAAQPPAQTQAQTQAQAQGQSQADAPAQTADASATQPADANAAGTAPAASTAADASGQQQAAAEQPQSIVIQPGNNLWRLSRKIYGKGRLYTVIYEANRDQVRNPNRIYPGQILTAPKPQN